MRDILSAVGVDPRKWADLLDPWIDRNLIEHGGDCPICDSPSFNFEHGKFKCDNCGSGDAVDLIVVTSGAGITHAEARTQLNKKLGINGKTRSNDHFTQIAPIPKDYHAQPDNNGFYKVFNTDKGKFVNYKPVRVDEYKNKEGGILFYVFRLEFKDKETGKLKKITPQVTLQKTGSGTFLCMRGYEGKRPLLGDTGKKNVIIVEGEKTRSAAFELVGHKFDVVTWCGGSNAIHKTDWSPLTNRVIAIWPDADPAGLAAALGYIDGPRRVKYGLIDEINDPDKLAVVRPDPSWGKGWDLHDALDQGWKAEDVINYIRGNQIEARCLPEKPQPNDSLEDILSKFDQAGEVEEVEEPEDDKPISEDLGGISEEIQCLGYNKETFFYMPASKRQLVTLTPNQHTKLNLLSMLSLDDWAGYYPGEIKTKNGQAVMVPDFEAAADDLMHRCRNAGIFDSRVLRGRGFWVDELNDGDPRYVLHTGSRLLVDGLQMGVDEIRSRWVYELAPARKGPAKTEITREEARSLFDVFKSFNWQSKGMEYLLAGYVVLAPLGGALSWRPHVHLCAESGSGKSTLFDRVVTPLMADLAISTKGSSTAPGVVRELGCDALPVLVDEFEITSQNAKSRIEDLMTIIRESSSDSESSAVLKAAANGGSQSFKVRSMFFLSSIQDNATLQADKTRIAKIKLVKVAETDGEQERWNKLNRKINDIKPILGRKMLTRTISMFPVVQESIDVFKKAASGFFGNARLGDTYGTLLAGAWCMLADVAPKESEALELIKMVDWSDQQEQKEQNDAVDVVNYLMQTQVKVEMINTSIAELCGVAFGKIEPLAGGVIAEKTAKRELALRGVIAEYEDLKPVLKIANNHQFLSKIFKNQPFGANWSSYLERIEGAKKSPPKSFVGINQRCVTIPYQYATR